MTQKTNNEGIAKGALIGAAFLAGSAAVVALRDKDTREKVGKTLKTMSKKGMQIKEVASEWLNDKQDEAVEAKDEALAKGKAALKATKVATA